MEMQVYVKLTWGGEGSRESFCSGQQVQMLNLKHINPNHFFFTLFDRKLQEKNHRNMFHSLWELSFPPKLHYLMELFECGLLAAFQTPKPVKFYRGLNFPVIILHTEKPVK